MDATIAVIRKGRKFDQVLVGAREVFLRDGFEGASVDDIARQAGVSKATLYSYFPDKRGLFVAVVHAECVRQSERALEVIDQTARPEQVLRQAGHHMLGFLMSRFAQRIFRICVAEADRFPELGRAFYESGPALAHERLADYLREACAAGQLQIDDIALAADQFAELCKTAIFARVMFGMQSEVSEAEMTRVVNGAVDMFLARYGTGGADGSA